MNREELAWCAGFFDGEGCVRFGMSNRSYGRVSISIVQIDRRVLDRFLLATGGAGNINGPYTYGRSKPSFSLAVTGFRSVQHTACLLWTWLSPIKREQFKGALRAAQAYHSLWKEHPTNAKNDAC